MNIVGVGAIEVVLGVQHPIPVEVLGAHHDGLDYLAALGGILGALAAIVALIVAVRSAKAASRSATASEKSLEVADESLGIMRQEAQAAREERERHADVDFDLNVRVFETSADSPPGYVMLDVGVSNDGTRAADSVLCNFYIPKQLSVRSSGPDGSGSGTGRLVSADQTFGKHKGDGFWADQYGPIGVGTITVRHLRLDRPPPGTYRLEASLYHDHLTNNERDRAWLIVIPADGGNVTLETVDPEEV
jgi:hypothetical protein